MLVCSPFYSGPPKTFQELKKRQDARRSKILPEETKRGRSKIPAIPEDSSLYSDQYGSSAYGSSYDRTDTDRLSIVSVGDTEWPETDREEDSLRSGRISVITLPESLDLTGRTTERESSRRTPFGSVGSIKSINSLERSNQRMSTLSEDSFMSSSSVGSVISYESHSIVLKNEPQKGKAGAVCVINDEEVEGIEDFAETFKRFAMGNEMVVKASPGTQMALKLNTHQLKIPEEVIKARFEALDKVYKVNGKEVRSLRDIEKVIGTTKEGDVLKFTIEQKNPAAREKPMNEYISQLRKMPQYTDLIRNGKTIHRGSLANRHDSVASYLSNLSTESSLSRASSLSSLDVGRPKRKKYTYLRKTAQILAYPVQATISVGKRSLHWLKKPRFQKPPISTEWMIQQEEMRNRLNSEDADLLARKVYYRRKFEEWRFAHRQERLFPTVLWFERYARRLNDEDYAALMRARREKQEEAERRRREWDLNQQRQRWLDHVAAEDNARRAAVVAQRKKENLTDETMMELQEAFYFIRHRTRLEKQAAERAKKEAAERENARLAVERSKQEQIDKENRTEAEDHAETQEVLQIMRKAGAIHGVNPPEVPEIEDERETTKVLTLRMNPNPPENQPKQRKKKGLSSKKFTVDLKRYRLVEELKGEKIGEVGGRALAKDLSLGFCPNLSVLILSWCDLKYRGSAALFTAFGNGVCPSLTKLHMDCNSIPDAVIQIMVECFKNGGLSALVFLDLSKNVISDKGALAICHLIVAGGLSKVEILKLNQNSIRDTGGFALYRAIIMEKTMLPHMQVFQLRDNPITTECKLRMNPMPKMLHV